MMQTLRDGWWLLGALAGLLAYCMRIGWKTREIMARIERLEKHDGAQRGDPGASYGCSMPPTTDGTATAMRQQAETLSEPVRT